MNPATRTALLRSISSQLNTILMADRGFETPADLDRALRLAIGNVQAAININEKNERQAA